MGKLALGVIAGIVVSGVVVALVELAGASIVPLPVGFDPARPDLALLGPQHFAPVAVAWLLGPLCGAIVATKVAASRSPWPPVVVGGVFTALCAFNLLAIPGSPVFLWVAGLAGPLPFALAGARVTRPRA
jgi:hypothetical protein